jgi:hypothetical protein
MCEQQPPASSNRREAPGAAAGAATVWRHLACRPKTMLCEITYAATFVPDPLRRKPCTQQPSCRIPCAGTLVCTIPWERDPLHKKPATQAKEQQSNIPLNRAKASIL